MPDCAWIPADGHERPLLGELVLVRRSSPSGIPRVSLARWCSTVNGPRAFLAVGSTSFPLLPEVIFAGVTHWARIPEF